MEFLPKARRVVVTSEERHKIARLYGSGSRSQGDCRRDRAHRSGCLPHSDGARRACSSASTTATGIAGAQTSGTITDNRRRRLHPAIDQGPADARPGMTSFADRASGRGRRTADM